MENIEVTADQILKSGMFTNPVLIDASAGDVTSDLAFMGFAVFSITADLTFHKSSRHAGKLADDTVEEGTWEENRAGYAWIGERMTVRSGGKVYINALARV